MTIMKKMLFTLVTMLTIAASANAMSYEQARNEALFLTDKMAYELNLSDAQYEAAYEINLDYLMGVTSQSDVFGVCWERRNMDLNYILYQWQWDLFRAATYFYRPLFWEAGYWHFGIYGRYPHRDYFYFGRPHFFHSYRGGHSWRSHGRSYYEGHRATFRPDRPRDQHFGMRNGWDRGDYRGSVGRSSTRITERGGHSSHSSQGNGSFRNNRSGNDSYRGNRSFDSNRSTGGSNDNRNNGSFGSGSSSHRSMDGSMNSGRSTTRSSVGSSHSGGSHSVGGGSSHSGSRSGGGRR